MSGADRASACVLVVIEDHPGTARGLEALLTRIGCEVEVAATGRGGIALCRERRPEAVLVDLSLPDMDGFAVLTELRAASGLEETRFIAMTGDATDNIRVRARRAGFQHFVKKPGSLETFRAVLGM